MIKNRIHVQSANTQSSTAPGQYQLRANTQSSTALGQYQLRAQLRANMMASRISQGSL